MDTNTIVTLVGSLGFPICACIGMGWYVKHQTDLYSQQIKEIRDEQNKQIDSIKEALNNNTMAIQRLVDRIDKE